MTVAELKKELEDADDDMLVMVVRDGGYRFHDANVEEMEIDISQPDTGYRESDMFTQSLHCKKVILIL